MANNMQFAGLEQQYGLPAGLLSAVMMQESGGNPNAISPKGATGAFQFMPATAQQYGIDPNDPNQSAVGAARMFSDLSQKYNGDVPSMLAGYNWGQGNVDRKGLNNAPPETVNYINKITGKLGQGTQYAQADTGNMTDGLPAGYQLENQASGVPQGYQLEAPKDNSNPGMSGVPNVAPPSAQDIYLNGNYTPSFGQNMANNFQSGLQSAKNFATFSDSNQTSAGDNLRQKYQAGTAGISDYVDAFMEGGANSPVGQAFNAVGGTALNPVTTAVGNYINPAIARNTGLTPNEVNLLEMATPIVAKGLGMAADATRAAPATDTLQEFKNNLPDNTQVSALGEHPSMMGQNSPSPAVLNAAVQGTAQSKEAQPISTTLPNVRTGTTFARSPNELEVGLEANKQISQAYDVAKTTVNNTESALRQNNIQITGGDFIPHIDNLIEHLSDKVLPDSGDSLALNQLKKIRNNIGDGSQLNSNDLLDVRQTINSIVGDGKFLKSGDASLLNAKAYVDNVLQRGAQENPQFANHLMQYKNASQDIARRFTGNKQLKSFWTPEDYIAWKANKNNPNMPAHSDGTISRANQFLDNMNKNSAGRVTAVAQALPSHIAKAVIRAAVVHANKGNSSLIPSLIKGVAKSATGVGAPWGIRDVVTALSTKPKTPPINTFIKNTKKMGQQ